MTADDIADTLWWVATLPPHLNINALELMPTTPELGRFCGPPERGLISDLDRTNRSAMSIENRLAELGITLPEAAAPVASYVPAVEANGLLHYRGQISFAEDGSLIKGRLGEDVRPRGRTGRGAALRNHAARPDEATRSARSTGSNGSSSSACSSIRPAISPTSPRSPMAPAN